ncbi:hypothetical protein B0H13DRAFT_2276613 [Mycena leptocephala]|nr:hypothetical protein B0H13DRAFT_2276613 [Mycena leptocephala]
MEGLGARHEAAPSWTWPALDRDDKQTGGGTGCEPGAGAAQGSGKTQIGCASTDERGAARDEVPGGRVSVTDAGRKGGGADVEEVWQYEKLHPEVKPRVVRGSTVRPNPSSGPTLRIGYKPKPPAPASCRRPHAQHSQTPPCQISRPWMRNAARTRKYIVVIGNDAVDGSTTRGRRMWDMKMETDSAVDVSVAKSGSVSLPTASLATVKELRFRIAPVPMIASVHRKGVGARAWCVELDYGRASVRTKKRVRTSEDVKAQEEGKARITRVRWRTEKEKEHKGVADGRRNGLDGGTQGITEGKCRWYT